MDIELDNREDMKKGFLNYILGIAANDITVKPVFGARYSEEVTFFSKNNLDDVIKKLGAYEIVLLAYTNDKLDNQGWVINFLPKEYNFGVQIKLPVKNNDFAYSLYMFLRVDLDDFVDSCIELIRRQAKAVLRMELPAYFRY